MNESIIRMDLKPLKKPSFLVMLSSQYPLQLFFLHIMQERNFQGDLQESSIVS
jgi:hypothetical protein